MKKIWFVSDAQAFATRNEPEDFFCGRLGLSGTDGTLVRVAAKLATAGHGVSLFNRGWNASCRGVHFISHDPISALKAAPGGEPDVIIFQCSFESVSRLVARFPKVRKLYWDQIGVDYRTLKLLSTRQLDEMICVSASAREFFRSSTAFPYVRVIYNLSDDIFLEPAPRNPDGRTILFVGALRPEKGFDRLALAWPAVNQAFPKARLLVAGSMGLHNPNDAKGSLAIGDYQARVIQPFQEWAKTAGANVEFLGTVGSRDLLALHASAVACIVNPAGGETFCCSAVEAQLCGNPVISVDSVALPEVTAPGETSLLVPPECIPALAEATLRLLQNPGEVQSFGKAARERALRLFGPEPIMKAWEQALDGDLPTPLHSRVPPGVKFRRDVLRFTGIGDQLRKRREMGRIGATEPGVYRPFRAG